MGQIAMCHETGHRANAIVNIWAPKILSLSLSHSLSLKTNKKRIRTKGIRKLSSRATQQLFF
jgi:hypothetical protein